MTTPVVYNHWVLQDPELIDKEWELDKLNKLPLESYDVVIAKSMGSGLVCKLLQDGRIKADKIILFGLPLKLAEKLGMVGWFDNLKSHVIIFQNEFDPVGSYSEVSDYLISTGNKVVCIPWNDTHSYTDFELYYSHLAL